MRRFVLQFKCVYWFKVLALMMLTILIVPQDAMAQRKKRQPEDKNAPKIKPPDFGYDVERKKAKRNEIINYQRGNAPVDNRLEHDPLATQGILFPSAYIPPEHHVIYRNHLIFGHQLSYAALERIMVTLGMVNAPGDVLDARNLDDMYMASLSLSVWRSQDVQLTISPMYMYREGHREFDSSEHGVGFNVVGDFVLADWLVLGVGWLGYRPTQVSYHDWDTSRCRSRIEYITRQCFSTKFVEEDWPTGGRWWQVYGQLTFYGPKGFFGKFELNTGKLNGTVLDLEGTVYGNDNAEVQAARYKSNESVWGSLYGVPLNAQFALGWAGPYVGGQVGLIMLPAGNARSARFGKDNDNFHRQYMIFLPVMSIGVRLSLIHI